MNHNKLHSIEKGIAAVAATGLAGAALNACGIEAKSSDPTITCSGEKTVTIHKGDNPYLLIKNDMENNLTKEEISLVANQIVATGETNFEISAATAKTPDRATDIYAGQDYIIPVKCVTDSQGQK